jgi:hypothetical protein
VLASLPRTRPQHSSPRRAAAREAAAPKQTKAQTGANGRVVKSANGDRPRKPAAARASTAKKRSTRATSAAARSAPERERVPPQGFACEGDRVTGPVQPPGLNELIASAAEIVGELGKAGVSAGERVLKDVVARLPLS